MLLFIVLDNKMADTASTVYKVFSDKHNAA